MNTKQINKDPLEKLFRQLPEEELPVSFRIEVMRQVTHEVVMRKKRNKLFGLLAVILASLIMASLAVVSIIYMELPKIALPQINPSAFSFYIYIGALSLFLLFLDYKIRRLFHKDE